MQRYLVSGNGSNLPPQITSNKLHVHPTPPPLSNLHNNLNNKNLLPHHNVSLRPNGIIPNYLNGQKLNFEVYNQSKIPFSKNGPHTYNPPYQIPVIPQFNLRPSFSMGCPILAPGNYHSNAQYSKKSNQQFKGEILPKYAGFKTLVPEQRKLLNQKQKFNPKIDIKIEEQTIFCVLCQTTYTNKEKQEHINKHKRGSKDERIKKLVFQYNQGHAQHQFRPIVEPQQYNIQYNPNKFILEEQRHFQTKQETKPDLREVSLGTNGDHQVSSSVPAKIQNEEEKKIEMRNTNISNDKTSSTRIPQMRQQNMDSMIDEQYSSNKTKNANQRSSYSIKNNSSQGPGQYQAQFSKQTFISDKPETVSIQKNSNNDYSNSNQNVRETITSYYFNDSSLKNGQKNSQFYNNKVHNAFDPNRMINALPLRNTVQSLEQSQTYQQASELRNVQGYPKYVDSQQYYMNMPQIREESQNRNTNSQGFKEDISLLEGPKRSNLRSSQKIQELAGSNFQPILSNNIQSLMTKKHNQQYEGISSKSQQVNKFQGSLLIDDYLFQNLQASQSIIPKDHGHKDNQRQIPIDYIIQQRLQNH